MFGWEVTTAPHLADNLGTNILKRYVKSLKVIK